MESSILVTGGAGYIGSHVCKLLRKEGYVPIVYDNLVNGHRWAACGSVLEIGDINDRDRLGAVIDRYRPASVIHLAAYADVGESVIDPNKYYSNNVAGTLSLLDVMRSRHINKLVFSSTCAIYGVPDTVPIKEDHPKRPVNPYGNSKQIIERILEDFGSAYGLRSVSLRYFNCVGADPDAEIGEAHHPETHLIPLLLAAASGDGPPATLYGDDYPTRDGTCIRDYIHVTDIAEAHLCAVRALCSGDNTTAYNLSNGLGFSVYEVISSIERVTGLKVPVQIGPRRPGDPPVLAGDSRRIRVELEWEPKATGLEYMVATAWAWHQKYVCGKNPLRSKVENSSLSSHIEQK